MPEDPPSGQTGAAWLAQLHSTDDSTAHEARLFLGGLGPSEAWMLSDFIEGTRAHDSGTRFWAATAISRLGSAATPAANRIRDLLDDPDPAVRSVAAGTAPAALSPLEAVAQLARRATSDSDEFVRRASARALIQIPPTARGDAVTALAPLLSDPTVAYAAAVAVKCLLLDEGGLPKGVDAVRLRAALQAALALDDAADQAEVAMAVLDRASDARA